MTLRLSTDYIQLSSCIINTRTGDAFELDDESLAILTAVQSQNLPTPSKKLNWMIKKGVIVDPIFKPKNKAFLLQWHLLNACNLSCSHCYDWKHKINSLSLKQMYKVVDDFIYFAKQLNAQPEISLTGGEPFLYPHLFDLIDYIKSRDLFVSMGILSNGSLIQEEVIPFLKKHDIAIQISLDGLEKQHDQIRGAGAYEKALSALKLLIHNEIKTHVHFVIMKRNINSIREFVYEMDNLGLNKITFSILTPIGSGAQEKMATPQELAESFNLIRELQQKVNVNIIGSRPLWALIGAKGACPIGHSTLTISTEGNILPCRRLPIVLGNVLENSFFKIWFGNDLLNKMRSPRENIKQCGQCKYVDDCCGCRAIAYAVTGDPFAPDPSCWLINE